MIHSFGKTNNNEVIIEVKTSNKKQSVLDGMKKDFRTLDVFTDSTTFNINYKLGIYILFNFDFFELINNNKRIKNHIKEILKNNKRIILWNIPNPIYINSKIDEDCIIKYSNHELLKKIQS